MPVDMKQVSRDTLYLAIFTTVTIMAWIGFAVIRSLTKSQVTAVLRQQIEPMPAGLNQAVLTNLKQRVQLTGEQFKLATPAATAKTAVTESTKSASMEIKATPTPFVGAQGEPTASVGGSLR